MIEGSFGNVSMGVCFRKSRVNENGGNVFEKLLFLDGLVWMAGVAVEIKLCFEIPPAA